MMGYSNGDDSRRARQVALADGRALVCAIDGRATERAGFTALAGRLIAGPLPAPLD